MGQVIRGARWMHTGGRECDQHYERWLKRRITYYITTSLLPNDCPIAIYIPSSSFYEEASAHTTAVLYRYLCALCDERNLKYPRACPAYTRQRADAYAQQVAWMYLNENPPENRECDD